MTTKVGAAASKCSVSAPCPCSSLGNRALHSPSSEAASKQSFETSIPTYTSDLRDGPADATRSCELIRALWLWQLSGFSRAGPTARRPMLPCDLVEPDRNRPAAQ